MQVCDVFGASAVEWFFKPWAPTTCAKSGKSAPLGVRKAPEHLRPLGFGTQQQDGIGTFVDFKTPCFRPSYPCMRRPWRAAVAFGHAMRSSLREEGAESVKLKHELKL